jgi:hypothetical protein
MPENDERSAFFPRGAIASFVAMALGYAGLWFAMYFLMTHRG